MQLLNSGENITCIDNTAYNNFLNGIRLYNIDDSTVDGNNAHHNGYDGIRILQGSERNVLSRNTANFRCF
ncbi:MAG: right-handed parallel beta-helix repeat-containing protein [Promethearchaeota archaeon]